MESVECCEFDEGMWRSTFKGQELLLRRKALHSLQVEGNENHLR